jgi:hypothetical protein
MELREIEKRIYELENEEKYYKCIKNLLSMLQKDGKMPKWEEIKNMPLDEVIRKYFVPCNISVRRNDPQF